MLFLFTVYNLRPNLYRLRKIKSYTSAEFFRGSIALKLIHQFYAKQLVFLCFSNPRSMLVVDGAGKNLLTLQASYVSIKYESSQFFLGAMWTDLKISGTISIIK